MHKHMSSTVFSQHPTVLLYLMILLGFPLQTNLHRVVTWPFKICSTGANFKLYGQGIFLLICSVMFWSVCILKWGEKNVYVFICSVMTRKYFGLLFLHYLQKDKYWIVSWYKILECSTWLTHTPSPSCCLFHLPHQRELHTNHILGCCKCTQCHEINLYQIRSYTPS